MLGHGMRIIVAFALLLLVSEAAAAQSITLRGLRSAVVVEAPDGDADILRDSLGGRAA